MCVYTGKYFYCYVNDETGYTKKKILYTFIESISTEAIYFFSFYFLFRFFSLFFTSLEQRSLNEISEIRFETGSIYNSTYLLRTYPICTIRFLALFIHTHTLHIHISYIQYKYIIWIPARTSDVNDLLFANIGHITDATNWPRRAILSEYPPVESIIRCKRMYAVCVFLFQFSYFI